MRLFETVLLLILVFTIKAQHEEEFTLNPDGSQDLSSQVEFDGLVLKVNDLFGQTNSFGSFFFATNLFSS